jgi:glycosyltransferase involved in cell wall biosynthesis
VLASWINKAESPVIFGGESLFFYKMLPHVKKETRRIELCHLPTWLHYTIGSIDLVSLRLFSTKNLKEEVIKQYNENHLGEKFYNRLFFIDNAIDIPPNPETHNEKLEVVFIGRGAPQKRVHLIAAIAKKMNEEKDAVHFSFVGDVENVINTNDFSFCKFYGNVNDDVLMNKIYSQSDVLILTSAYEGLPIVVMKMMAYGKVVVSTAVNGIPDYIKNMENGLLITATNDEEIVKEAIRELRLLIQNPHLKQQLGKRSRDIAIEKFSEEKFAVTYRKILLDPNVNIVESE